MSAQKNKKKTTKKKIHDVNMTRQLKAIAVIGAAVFLFAGLQFTEQTGFLGRILDIAFRVLLGDAALVLPFLLAVSAFAYLWPRDIENLTRRLVGLAIIFLLLTITLHLRAVMPGVNDIPGSELYRYMLWLGMDGSGGGTIGALLSTGFFFLFRDLGSYIVTVVLGIVALLMITNSSIFDILKPFYKSLKSLFLFGVGNLKNVISSGKEKAYRTKAAVQDRQETEPYKIMVEADDALGSFEQPLEYSEMQVEEQSHDDMGHENERPAREGPAVQQQITGQEQDKQGYSEGLAQLSGEKPPFEDYKLPPLELLTKVNRLRDQQQQKITQERAKALESTFASFGVKAKIKEVQSGPAVTRFEVQPETGVKVSKILSLSDDLALNLAASDVRIEAPIPGKQAVGIEVPNKIISLVYLREVLEDSNFYSFSSPLTVGLGKDITGVPVFADLLKMPHLLVAGSTGSGKSVCINSIICSVLLKADPWLVKFLLIDPKVVELNVYNGIPHLISPVITEPKKASLALKNMTKEMERRYDLFAREGVRDITKYNELFASDEEMEGNPLPFIIVLIDELADLMMVAPSEVEDSIVRLSQMSRAAGIHLVIATQRPSVDVITGLIKANITSRIAFAVSSATDSRTILDMGGAEKLLGRGDMLYHPIGSNKSQRVQGAFISEQDIFKIVEFIKQQESPVYQQSFFEEEVTERAGEKDELDPLLTEVAELVLHSGQASISLIQRRFRVGYTRAARLMDDLERLGIVGQHEGSKPRRVLVSQEKAMSMIKEKFDLE